MNDDLKLRLQIFIIFRSNQKQLELFLDGILHRRIDSLDDLTTSLNFLNDDFLKTSPDVKLIVIDRFVANDI